MVGDLISKVEHGVGVITIGIVVSIIGFLIVEFFFSVLIACGLASSNTKFPKDYYFQPRPFLMYSGTTDPILGREAGLNELGYRGPVPSPIKASNHARIFMLGGSTVLVGDPTLSELLEQYFRAGGLDTIEVYNFGVPASTTRMDIVRFIMEVRRFEPDLIIFYGSGNDIGMPYQADPRPGYPPNFFSIEASPYIKSGTVSQSIGDLILLGALQSRLVETFAGDGIRQSIARLRPLRDQVGWGTREWTSKIANTYLNDILLAVDLSIGFDCKLLVVTQPILYFKHHMTEAEMRFHDPGLANHAKFARSLIQQGLTELKARRDLHWLDLTGIFSNTTEEVFLDGIHINQRHFEPIAREIFSAVRDHF